MGERSAAIGALCTGRLGGVAEPESMIDGSWKSVRSWSTIMYVSSCFTLEPILESSALYLRRGQRGKERRRGEQM